MSFLAGSLSGRSNRSRKFAISLTPLIDVVFILLLFFMLTSTFTRFHSFEFSAASVAADTASWQQPAPRLIRILNVDEIALGGQKFALRSSRFAELVMELDRTARPVLVAAGEGVSVQLLISVLEHLQKLGLSQIELVPSTSVAVDDNE